jgi:hypothetical protein
LAWWHAAEQWLLAMLSSTPVAVSAPAMTY